jgi:serine/threonine protein kinase
MLRKARVLTRQTPEFHGRDDKRRAIYLEYIQGTPLSARRDSMSAQLLQRCNESLTRTIHALHQAGIAHRDIRSENILVRDGIENNISGRVDDFLVLIGFGLSSLISRTAPDGTKTRWKGYCHRDLSRLNLLFSEEIAKAVRTSACLLTLLADESRILALPFCSSTEAAKLESLSISWPASSKSAGRNHA